MADPNEWRRHPGWIAATNHARTMAEMGYSRAQLVMITKGYLVGYMEVLACLTDDRHAFNFTMAEADSVLLDDPTSKGEEGAVKLDDIMRRGGPNGTT